MCRAVRCKTCGGTTWAGCGEHVDGVMRNVPQSQRCSCAPDATPRGGFLAGLFRRS